MNNIFSNTNVEEVSNTFVEKFQEILADPDARYSFYMQELDGASRGNSTAKKWVESKDVRTVDYKGFDDDNMDAEQVQMALITWHMSLGRENLDKTVQTKCDVVDAIMEKTK
tara:strand:+ start:607 stop:942 length:336 start_codon:yes stop_codon:yes gene_type:complete